MPTEVATVPVKSSWFSKINWIQGMAFVAMLASFFGIDDGTLLAQVEAGIIAASTLLTTITRTWFTKDVTAASMAK